MALCSLVLEGAQLAKPNFQFEKRQRELAKKKKKEEKMQRKLEKSHSQPQGEHPGGSVADPESGGSGGQPGPGSQG
jgi:hypothetical protein